MRGGAGGRWDVDSKKNVGRWEVGPPKRWEIGGRAIQQGKLRQASKWQQEDSSPGHLNVLTTAVLVRLRAVLTH